MEETSALRKIQGLIDKAHGNTTDAEALALLAKADEMMIKYSIGEGMLLDPNRPDTARPIKHQDPEVRTIVVLMNSDDSEYFVNYALREVFQACADHLFVRIGTLTTNQARVVGYPVDLNFLEMFFLKIKLHMFSHLITTVDPEEDWVKVMVGLKNMGHTWQRVHEKLQSHPEYPYQGMRWERRFGVKFTGLSKKYTEEHDLPRNKSSNPKAWREDFVDGYSYKIRQRLREMREATVRQNDNLPALINGKRSIVEEAFFTEFPDLRPHPPECECDVHHPIKCHDDSCQRVICERVRANRNKPIRRSRVHYRNLNVDAYGSGGRVAAKADLSDKGPLG